MLGKKISELRRERGMTQAELAETLHYTAQTISNWERGVSSPDSETLLMLADFFGVTTDELLGKESVSDETTGFSSSVSGKPFQHTKSTDYYAEPTSAALALRVLLWISVGLAALLVLLVWLRTPAALVIFAVLSIGFRLLYLADFVVLMVAKEWVGEKVVKTFFFGALLCGNIVSFFTENVPELVYLQVALSLTFLITAPFVFCPASEDPGEVRRGRKIYFVGIVILFLFEIISAIGGSVIFETLFLLGGELYGICCLAAMSKNRIRQVPYQSEHGETAALFSDSEPDQATASAEPKQKREYRPDILLSAIFWTAAVCWVLMAVMSPAPLAVLAICGAFVPFVFFAVFWFVKEGIENRTLHWITFAVWGLCMLTACFFFFAYVLELAVKDWVFWTFEVNCLAVFVLVVLLFRGSLRAGVKATFIVLAVLLFGIACFFGASGMEDGFSMMAAITVFFYLIFFFLAGLKKDYRKKPLRTKEEPSERNN